MAYKRVYVYWVLVILTLLNVINQWELYLPSYLSHTDIEECQEECKGLDYQPDCVECSEDEIESDCMKCKVCRSAHAVEEVSMRDDLCLDDTDYAVVTGISFTLPFCLMILVVGWAIDRFRHLVVEILVGAEILMSLSSALQAATTSFVQLALTRGTIGICLAFSTPCVITIIAEIFPRDQRSYANGIFCLGTYMGYALACLSVMSTLYIGWRSTVLCISIFGMIIIFALGVSVKNPEMPHVPASVHLSWEDLKKRLAKLLTTKLYYILVTASSLREMGRFILMISFKDFTRHQFNVQYSQYSIFSALASSMAALISCYFGGRFGTIYSKKFPAALAIIPAVGCFGAMIPMFGAVFAPNIAMTYACVWFAFLFGECWMGPSFAILQNFLPNDTVGIATGIYMLIITALGTTAADFLNDFDNMPSQDYGFRSTMICSLSFSYIGSGLLYSYLAKLIRDSKSHTSPRPNSDDDELVSLITCGEQSNGESKQGKENSGRQRA
mmetsp:Transcript_36311/g.45761  ORF Transcript_36311/g.45761 Transcript_36311/m.45761 type:complete len:499 (+) Transcript_36311:77-1573(+)